VICDNYDDAVNYPERIRGVKIDQFLSNDSMYNLKHVCAKWGFEFESYNSYKIGTCAIAFIYDDYVLKATNDILQCLDASRLVDTDYEYSIRVFDVYNNVILSERADLTTIREYDYLSDVIYRCVNSNIVLDFKIIKDLIKCGKYYTQEFNLESVDVNISNIGINSYGNYVAFDW
jgi:hypothetical protein